MPRLVSLLRFAVTAVPRLASALPFGQDTLIIYEYTGNAIGNNQCKCVGAGAYVKSTVSPRMCGVLV